MKKMILQTLALMTLSASPAFATGGFDCLSAENELAVAGNTSWSYGNALTRDPEFQIFGEKKSISAAQYKNQGSELYLLAVEDYNDASGEFKQRTIELKARVSKNGTAVGEMSLKVDGQKPVVEAVNCWIE